MNRLKLLILLEWFISIESWTCCFSNLRYWNNKTYFRLLLLLSRDISLNPGPINGSQQHNYDQWAVFKKRGLHFVHININSLLPKIHELRYIAKLSEAAVIGFSESKLDDSVLSFEIQIENYELIRSDKNRHGGGVACFIRNYLSCNTKWFLPSERKHIHRDFFTSLKASCCGYYLSST